MNNTAHVNEAGAVQAYTLEAECVRFENNTALREGGAIFLVFDADIHNSSFTGNSAGLDGNQIYSQGWTVNAQQNWWATTPTVPDEVTSTVNTSSPHASNEDPTWNYVDEEDYYDSSSPCAMDEPVPLPPICPQGVMLQNGGVTIQQEICVVPTNTPTPTPTNTPTNTPTPTPIGTITPGMCSITVNIDLALRLSPTRYSPRVATIPLGTALTAVYRVDLQEGGWQEIWYQVNYAGNDGWIAAKIGPDEFANPLTCSLPLPYSNDWQAIAQIESSEIPAGCDIDAYLRSEPAALVLARLAYGEAASFNTTISGGMGGVVYTDATRAAWIARMDAFLGLAYYGQGYAGQSFPIVEEILRRSEVTQQGPFQPLTDLRTELLTNGCNPSAIIDPNKDNVQRMVYPTNRPSASGTVGIAELYELWRIYQEVVNNVINTPWTNMPTDIRGFEQFKGIQSGQPCPSGANNLTRPGSGFTWTANQPYSPQQVYQYIDPAYGGTGGANQSFFTCYQDVYHLDDWFWNVGIGQITDPATSTFPRQFCVVDLVNPGDPEDIYPLAQLRGLDNNPWPPAAPNNPACTFTP